MNILQATRGAEAMSLTDLLPLVDNLSQPDKERLFEYLGTHIDQEDSDDEPEEIVLASLRRSLQQIKDGKVHPIAELWEGIDVG
jgi:hypothetical protein